MKKKNKRKKALSAMGAVVVAGLTPGISSSMPTLQSFGSDIRLTAADKVTINGEDFEFEELFAMQQIRHGRPGDRPQAVVYGPRPRKQDPEKEKMKKKEEETKKTAKVLRERKEFNSSISKLDAIDSVQLELIESIANIIDADSNGIIITPDSHFINDLKMDSIQLEELSLEIKRCYSVQLRTDRLLKLATLRRLAVYIVEKNATIGKKSDD